LGAHGLVYANVVNMFVRIVWSFGFVRRFLHRQNTDLAFKEFALRPQTYAVGAAVTAMFSALKSNIDSYGDVIPFGLGGSYVLLVLYSEREHIMKLYTKLQETVKFKVTQSKTD
jgi:oligosaccharide translocation protein RFT1